jgi:hypothetical protein
LIPGYPTFPQIQSHTFVMARRYNLGSADL